MEFIKNRFNRTTQAQPIGQKTAPEWPKIAPTWHQNGSKNLEPCPATKINNSKNLFACVTPSAQPIGQKIAPKWPKITPKTSQIEPRWDQDAPKWSQNGAKMGSTWRKNRRETPAQQKKGRTPTESLHFRRKNGHHGPNLVPKMEPRWSKNRSKNQACFKMLFGIDL